MTYVKSVIDSQVKDIRMSKVNRDDFSLNVTISKLKRNDSNLLKSYNIEKYLDSRSFSFRSEERRVGKECRL